MLIPKVRSNNGFFLLEVLIALGVFGLTVGSAFLLFFGGQSATIDSVNSERSLELAREGIEAARSIRDRNWDELTPGNHGLVRLSDNWYFGTSSATSSDSQEIFTRTVSISAVDDSTKKASTTVTWQTDPNRLQKVELVTIVTAWEKVIEENQNLGGDGGGSGTSGDWLNPQTLGSIDLGAGLSANDLDVLEKIIYIAAEASDSKKKDFFVINATNGASPFILSSLNTGSGLNAVDVAGNYAYVGNKSANAQLQIINISNPNSPTLTTSYQLPGVSGSGAVGNSIFFYSNKIYIGTKSANGSEFHIVDVANPSSPQSLGSFEIGSDVNMIQIKGNFAYLATPSDSAELKILDISNPSQILSVGSYNASGSADGKSLYLVGTKLYLGRSGGGDSEFLILDVSDPAAVSLLGSAEIESNVNDLRTRDNFVFIGTSDSNKEFQVWNVANIASPTLWSSFNFPQVASGIDYEDNIVYVSVRSNDAIRIITSGP